VSARRPTRARASPRPADAPRPPARSGVERRLQYLREWELANVALMPGLVWLMWLGTGDPAGAWTRRAIGVAAVSYLF
jgi:hypothetical protein